MEPSTFTLVFIAFVVVSSFTYGFLLGARSEANSRQPAADIED